MMLISLRSVCFVLSFVIQFGQEYGRESDQQRCDSAKLFARFGAETIDKFEVVSYHPFWSSACVGPAAEFKNGTYGYYDSVA